MTATPTSTLTPPEERPEPDLSGRQVGDYQLLRRLGRGGMADVYLAEQLSLRRQVALKVLKRNLAGAFEMREDITGTVIVVDDVYTTGATMNEIARTLKRSGARE